MITMTHMGEHCKMHLPVCAAFVTRMRTEFPQAQWSYVYGIRPLIEVVISEALMDEFQKVIDEFYDSEGNIRDQIPKAKYRVEPDEPVTPPDKDEFKYTDPHSPSFDPDAWFDQAYGTWRPSDDMEARRQKVREDLRREAQAHMDEEFMRQQGELLKEAVREAARKKAAQEEVWRRARERAQEQARRGPGPDPHAYSEWWKKFQEEAAREAERQRRSSPPPSSPPPSYATHTSIDVKMQITRQYPHHAELGIIPGAPSVVVRAAFRALALIYHPDKPEGSTEKMQKLNKAFAEVKKYERIQD